MAASVHGKMSLTSIRWYGGGSGGCRLFASSDLLDSDHLDSNLWDGAVRWWSMYLRPLPLAVFVWGLNNSLQSLVVCFGVTDCVVDSPWRKGICGSPVGWLVPATGVLVLAGVTCGWHTAGFCRSLSAASTFLVLLDFNSFAVALLVAVSAAVFPSFPPKGGRGRGGDSGRDGHARDARCRTTEEVGNAVLALQTWCKREGRLPKQRSTDPEERRLAVWIKHFRGGKPAVMTSAQQAEVEELLLRLNRRPGKLEVSGAIATTPPRVTRGGSAGTPTGSVRPGSSASLSSVLESRNATVPTLSRRESKKDDMAALATCWQRARLAPDDYSCLARVWSGTQCRRRRAVRSDGTGGLGEFCALHQKNQSLYGRVDNSMPDADLEKLVRRAAACEQQSGFKWYSRLRMWDIASAKSVQSVDGLSNDDFLECLQAVNLYFQKNDVQRHAWGLTPHAGPQSVADRADLAKMDYVGDPRRFRFYAVTVFRRKLESLVAGSTELVNGRLHLTDRATEQQFMVALDLTSRAMQDMHVVRSSGAVCHYRGPQCFTHRHDVERLGFEPLPVACPPGLAGRVTPPARRRMDFVMPMVQCDEPLCRKWRRIDGATRDLFHGEGWGSDRIHDARRELLESHVWLESVCANWVQRRWPQADRSELCVADVAAYEAFVQSDARVVECERLHPASLLQLFVDACAGQIIPRAEDLDEARRCVWGSLPGVCAFVARCWYIPLAGIFVIGIWLLALHTTLRIGKVCPMHLFFYMMPMWTTARRFVWWSSYMHRTNVGRSHDRRCVFGFLQRRVVHKWTWNMFERHQIRFCIERWCVTGAIGDVRVAAVYRLVLTFAVKVTCQSGLRRYIRRCVNGFYDGCLTDVVLCPTWYSSVVRSARNVFRHGTLNFLRTFHWTVSVTALSRWRSSMLRTETHRLTLAGRHCVGVFVSVARTVKRRWRGTRFWKVLQLFRRKTIGTLYLEWTMVLSARSGCILRGRRLWWSRC